MRTNKIIKFILVTLTFSLLSGCDSSGLEEQNISNLCNKIQHIKKMPLKPNLHVNDKIYNEIMGYGEKMIPCLVSKISDTTVVPHNPIPAPRMFDKLVVGDIALFLLQDIADFKYTDILPVEVTQKFDTIGFYAYYDFVEKTENRILVQKNTLNWFKTNKPAIVK